MELTERDLASAMVNGMVRKILTELEHRPNGFLFLSTFLSLLCFLSQHLLTPHKGIQLSLFVFILDLSFINWLHHCSIYQESMLIGLSPFFMGGNWLLVRHFRSLRCPLLFPHNVAVADRSPLHRGLLVGQDGL